MRWKGERERRREAKKRERETKKGGERWGSPWMSSAFEFEIGNRVAGHCSALQLMLLSLYESVLFLLLPSSSSSSVFWAVQMVQCSPADIKKPRRPTAWECTLFSTTFTVIQQHTQIHQRPMHAGCKYHSNSLGDESHDLYCFTYIMNICWCTSIWTQEYTHVLLHTSMHKGAGVSCLCW